MTSKEFKMWLEGFLLGLNLDDVVVRKEFGVTYNHLTMLKTINNKLKEVKDLEENNTNTLSTLLTERIVPVTPPNPFTISCEDKNEE
ncbi:hypothetical protein N9322_00625 [bacterium]|jgi:hypothetical protein|nr:hypothetical protein [bacterium]|tara:strand:+ start:1103 stop:1363 length:261 start_codon:yes stop_codon:yes gene_type:complete